MAKNVKKVICELCNTEISASNYSKHLRRHTTHPETFIKKYHVDHPGLNCKFCNKLCKNNNSLVQHEIRCSKNPDKIDTSNSWGNSNLYKTVWNKGLTKEIDERLLRASETYKINKKLGLHKTFNSMNNAESRRKLSETISKKVKDNTWHTSLAKNMHYTYKGVDLHGSWEVKYAKYLDDCDIKWERCIERFPYMYEEKIHYYTPDFYLPETGTFVEIKGYATKKDYEKWKQFPKDIPFKVLMKKDLILLGIDID